MQAILSNQKNVTSFNGRTKDVTPAAGDYTAAMVGAIANPATGTVGQILEKTADGAQWVDKPASGMSQVDADARYLQLNGGTMTGNLILNGSPAEANQAANKSYVDSKAPVSVPITLTVGSWSSNQQVANVSGVLADETAQIIMPTPALASLQAYQDAEVKVIAQAANSLTFSCSEVPASNLTVYVVIQGVSQ